jgi:hypothetical protein
MLLHHIWKNVEHFSYFYLKTALFQESSEKIMCSKRVNGQYQVKTSNMFAALENLNDDVDINSAWQILDNQNFSEC